MAAAKVDRRLLVVEAGLQWAWAARHQVRRLHLHERAMDALLARDDPVPAPGWQARFFAMRSDAEFCVLACENLARAIEEISPDDRTWPMGASSEGLVDAIVTLRQAFLGHRPPWRRAGAGRRRTPGVIDLRDDPRRCAFGMEGMRICGLTLDDLDAALEPVADCFIALERTAFAWEGWRAVGA